MDARFTSKFVTPGNRKQLARRVAGRVICSVRRHGKFIVMNLDEGILMVHLGMTGKLLFNAEPSRHSHGIFTLDEGTLVFDDPRQFGRIEWGDARLAKLGPEPLEVDFDEFFSRLKVRKTRIKALLLDQTFLRGMGNIYADESLFRAGISPRAIASRINMQRAERLHQSIREVLTEAIQSGGSSISDYVDADGNRGWFQVLHRVYGRQGEPCTRCGSAIRRILIGGRSSHYCAKCQR
jgi:formamidopyrimidine-DNA glycosylase